MTLRSHFALAALSILATAALAATSADARPGQGRGQRPQPTAPVVEILPPVEALLVTDESPTAELLEVIAVDSPVQAAPPSGRQNLPPGLQRQGDSGRGLPPGLQRQVDSGRGLPPGLQRQVDSGRGLPPGLQRGQ